MGSFLIAVFVVFVPLGIIAVVLNASAKKDQARRKAEDAQRAWEARNRQFADLAARWGPQVATGIMRGDVWQGQTEEQLALAIGWPVDIDDEVLKTKRKQTWKYRPLGANRYGLRVMLENGIVVGWKTN